MALVIEEINRVVINEEEELEEFFQDTGVPTPAFDRDAIIEALRKLQDTTCFGVFWDFAWDSVTITEYREVVE